jgi:hypothetical protein
MNYSLAIKKKQSTSMCLIVLEEAIAYNVNHKFTVNRIFLNATKAFDEFVYCNLFQVQKESTIPYCQITLANILSSRLELGGMVFTQATFFG